MSKNDDFYQKLRTKLKKWAQSGDGKTNKWAEYIMFAPDLFHLLCKLALDPEVPAMEKAKLAIAIGYFISPIDILPEGLIGPVGYADDVVLAAYVLNSVINNTPRQVVDSHWAGEGDVLDVTKRILEVADEMLGSGLVKKIKGLLGGNKM
jgi:uncharacterized membrane protein YkvA (DUF1232 family)